VFIVRISAVRKGQDRNEEALMGQLVDGTWHDVWYDTTSTGGAFERTTAKFRNWITADGAAGPTGEGGFPAVSGRYHLYVSYACPWAHRTLIFRALKGLEAHISISAVHPDMLSEGWTLRQMRMGPRAIRSMGCLLRGTFI
jgi:glutathionyl-hydroquinone reductase